MQVISPVAAESRDELRGCRPVDLHLAQGLGAITLDHVADRFVDDSRLAHAGWSYQERPGVPGSGEPAQHRLHLGVTPVGLAQPALPGLLG